MLIQSAGEVIKHKVKRQIVLLSRYKKSTKLSVNVANHLTLSYLLLEEARAAKKYWKQYSEIIPAFDDFSGRHPRADDITNRLLNIGYHHLGDIVRKILTNNNIPPEVGLIHSARRMKSSPLVYDIMEMFRADVVDAEVVRFLRLKKKPFAALSQENTARFLRGINKRIERKFYLSNFKECRSYRYYIELQILKLVFAVNNMTIFHPINLPVRHDSRCSKKFDSK